MAGAVGRSIVFVVLFVLAVWAVAQIIGFNISLIGTLVSSVVLTIALNGVLYGIRQIRS